MTPAETCAADVMAEIERLRSMVRELASERDDLVAALKRHTQWFTGPGGVKTCGGCLYAAPCPDAVLAEVPSP